MGRLRCQDRCYTGVTPPPPRRPKALGFRGLGHFAARTENPRVELATRSPNETRGPGRTGGGLFSTKSCPPQPDPEGPGDASRRPFAFRGGDTVTSVAGDDLNLRLAQARARAKIGRCSDAEGGCTASTPLVVQKRSESADHPRQFFQGKRQREFLWIGRPRWSATVRGPTSVHLRRVIAPDFPIAAAANASRRSPMRSQRRDASPTRPTTGRSAPTDCAR